MRLSRAGLAEVKFALFVNIQCREGFEYKDVYRARMDECVLAEDLGFDAFFLAEHAFCEHGRPSPAVSLGHLAARTSRIRLGTAVSVLSWHNPLEVAQDYATVDILSGGRLNFGIGRGGSKHEFNGYGVDWETSPERYREALAVVLRAWQGEPFSFKGRFFEFPELYVNPMPVQRPHPPLFQPTVTQAAMDAVVPQNITPIVGATFGSKTRIRDNFAHLAKVLERERRTDMDRIALPLIFVGDTVEQARRDARESVEWLLGNFAANFEMPEGEEYPERFLGRKRVGEYIRSLTYDRVIEEDLMWIGDADHVAERLKWLRDECGVSYVISNMCPGGMEHGKVARSLELFAARILPRFRDGS